MTRILFPFTADEGFVPDVETVECTEAEWAQVVDRDSPEWSVCHPVPGSTNCLVRAVRLVCSDSTRGAAPRLRLVGT